MTKNNTKSHKSIGDAIFNIATLGWLMSGAKLVDKPKTFSEHLKAAEEKAKA